MPSGTYVYKAKGYLNAFGYDYATLRTSSNPVSEIGVSAFYRIGQQYLGGGYTIYEQFGLMWLGALSINEAAPVSGGVEIQISIGTDASDTDFVLEAHLDDWVSPISGSDWVRPVDMSSSNVIATLNTSSISGAGWYTMTMTALGKNMIQDMLLQGTGAVEFPILLTSSRVRAGNTPSGLEYVGISNLRLSYNYENNQRGDFNFFDF